MPLFSLQSLQSLGTDFKDEARYALESFELRDLVARELMRLPQREREAITALAGLSTESCRSVARKHGVSAQTVSNWAKEAQRKLRPKLEAYA